MIIFNFTSQDTSHLNDAGVLDWNSDFCKVSTHLEEGYDKRKDIYYLTFTTNYGYKYGSNWKTQDELEVKIMQIRLQKHLNNGGKLNPEKWFQKPHAYGSKAYQFEGGETEVLAREAHCNEKELLV